MVQPWKRIKDETVFKNAYARLDKVTFELPDGEEHDYFLHGTNEHIASVFALTKNGEIILAREYRPGPDLVLDEIPGGLIDEGETPKEAAQRELFEETGYKGEITLMGKTFISAYSPKIKYCFLARNCIKAGEPQNEAHEFIDVILKTKEELEAQISQGLLTDMETALFGLRALEG